MCPLNSLTICLIFNQSIIKYIQLVIKISRIAHVLRYHRPGNPFIFPDNPILGISSFQATSFHEISSVDGIDRTLPYDEKELVNNLQDLKDKSQDFFEDLWMTSTASMNRIKIFTDAP